MRLPRRRIGARGRACGMTATNVSQGRCFGGEQGTSAHASVETGCTMRFGVCLPPEARAPPAPVLYWLCGLTCTEENLIVTAGAQRVAAELGIALVVPNTSPRGLNIPGDAASCDFGLGAGFCVDATEAPWAQGYRSYSYVVRELPEVVASAFPVDAARAGIFGHRWAGMAR
jgi:S-formylglutathione hydrolase